MKLLKNRGFAVFVLILAVALSSWYGISKRPQAMSSASQPDSDLAMGLSTAAFERYVVDEAHILSAGTEEEISLYNANWDILDGSIIAVVTARDAGDVEDAAWDWMEKLELGENDAILFLDAGASDYCLVTSGTFCDKFDGDEPVYLNQYFYEDFMAARYDAAVLSLFEQIHAGFFRSAGQAAAAYEGQNPGALSVILSFIPVIMLLVVMVALFNVIDRMRYAGWNRRYGSMGVPPVVFRPVFWWHRPGSAWSRRRGNPPPPPPPGGPGSFGGPRPPVGPRPPGNSGPRPSRPSSPPRSGSGGSGRGGGFGSGGRVGFGGSSRGGGPRGGGFGGRR